MKTSPTDLRGYLRLLQEHRWLRVIQGPVDIRNIPHEVLRHEKKREAVLFKEVKNREGALVSNLLTRRESISLALGCAPEETLKEYARRIDHPVKPVILSKGPSQQVIRTGKSIDAGLLPALTHCERDAGPYITAGIAIAKDPETSIRNVSINRIQVIGPQELLINIPQHLGKIQAKAEAEGKPLEVAIAVGNHPIELITACSNPPFGADEFDLSGGLREKPLDLVPCKTLSIEVPARAEMILEGEIPPYSKREEGPFGDFMGYYVPITRSHVFRLKAITHRKGFIFQAIKAGSVEDTHLLSLPREAALYSALIAKGIEVKSVSLHTMLFNGFVSIRKKIEDEAKAAIAVAFKTFPWLKYCVVVDHDVDIFDAGDVWWAVGTRGCPQRGTVLIDDSPGFYRDPYRIHQSKLGIDATAPLGQWSEFERTRVFKTSVQNVKCKLKNAK
jgi:2,5-furandicarboxylate decarboxylase 1